MDAVAAVDALILIDDAVAVLIVADGTDRAGLLAGTDQVHDGTVGTCCCAHAALLALRGVDVGAELADGDGAEAAGIQARLAKAQAAVVRNGVGGQRALVAGGLDDLHDVVGVRVALRVLRKGEADSLSCDFSLLIDAAAVRGLGAGNQIVDEFVHVCLVQLVGPGKLGHFLHDLVFVAQQTFITSYHILLSFRKASVRTLPLA